MIAKTGMKLLFRPIAVCAFLGSIGLTLASADSNVLMLDTRNLKGRDENWGHGKDYMVKLAKDPNRGPLPRQFTMCNSNFVLGLVRQQEFAP